MRYHGNMYGNEKLNEKLCYMGRGKNVSVEAHV